MHNIGPEAQELQNQIKEAQKLIASLKKQIAAKIKELNQNIQKDNLDLFGERKSEPPGIDFLFSERVDPSGKEKALQPLKSSLQKSIENLKNLESQKNTIKTTEKLF